MSKLGDVLSKLVYLKRITDGHLGAEPQAAGDFLKKIAFLMPWITIRTFSEPFEELDFKHLKAN